MKKFLKSFLISVVLLQSLMAIPSAVSAQVLIPKEYLPTSTPFRNSFDGTNAGNSASQDIAVTTTIRILQILANIMLFIAAPLAVLMITHGGMSYAFAMGEQGKIDGAKREITWAILGLIMIITSYIVVNMLIQGGIQSDEGSAPKNEENTTTEEAAPADTTP